MKYAVIIEQAATGFSAYIHLKSMMEDGDPIPEPTSPREQVDMTKPRKRSKAGRSGRLLSL